MMDGMIIENAKYYRNTADEITAVDATIDGIQMSVPLDPANRHYAEIMRQVEAGELVIQPAE